MYRKVGDIVNVSEAFDKGIIPMKYIDIVPKHCKCGAELEISESLTKLWCPSDKCTHKQIARMNEMLTNFGAKSIGLSYCSKLWEEMKRCGLDDSHMNVFLLPYYDYPEGNSSEVTLKRFNEIQNIVKDSIYNGGYTLGELVSKMSLPGLDLNARKLFNGFNSLRELQIYARRRYTNTNSPILSLIQDRFGYGVMCRKVLHTLSQFVDDIEIAQNIFGIRKCASREIKVSITGRISSYGAFSRKEFLREINKLCDGFAEVIDVNPSSDIEFVIADDIVNSSTYDYGEEYGLLINSRDFVKWIKEEVIGCV